MCWLKFWTDAKSSYRKLCRSPVRRRFGFVPLCRRILARNGTRTPRDWITVGTKEQNRTKSFATHLPANATCLYTVFGSFAQITGRSCRWKGENRKIFLAGASEFGYRLVITNIRPSQSVCLVRNVHQIDHCKYGRKFISAFRYVCRRGFLVSSIKASIFALRTACSPVWKATGKTLAFRPVFFYRNNSCGKVENIKH